MGVCHHETRFTNAIVALLPGAVVSSAVACQPSAAPAGVVSSVRSATAACPGGMVTVVMNGVKEIQSLTIDPEVVSRDDVEMLQDLIVAAITDAQRRADDLVSQRMGGMMGGLKIPGLT